MQDCGEALTETYVEPSHRIDAATLVELEITAHLQRSSSTAQETWPHVEVGRIHRIDGHREYVKTKRKLVSTERRMMVKLMSLSALYCEGWCKVDPNAYFTHILILWPPMHVHFSLFLIHMCLD